MLSLGRDKAVSGVVGGALVCRTPEISAQLQQRENDAQPLGYGTILRLLLYPSAYWKARLFYGIGIGKAALWLLGKIGMLPAVLTTQERRGSPSAQLHALPHASAALALPSLRKLHSINNHRRTLVAHYLQNAAESQWSIPQAISEDLPLQKFPVYIDNPDALRASLKRKNIYLDDAWTGAVVCPRTSDQTMAGYTSGSCPEAEWVAQHILSLPTHPTMTLRQADKLVIRMTHSKISSVQRGIE